MEDYVVLQTLRDAIYGKVVLVRHRATDAVYAMKMMSLTHMAARQAVAGPAVREDGNTELRMLRRLSGNRVMESGSGLDHGTASGEGPCEMVARSSWSVHPLWEAWGRNRDEGTSVDDHHNVLLLHTDFVDERANARCLVFDFCPFGELYDQLQVHPQHTLDIGTTRVLFKQIVTAVGFIHTQNIAHRDLSLENVLIDANRQCRLGDFGLACEYGTMCSGRVGKAFYMAPEVYNWQPDELYNGLKADIWSLGIVLFILVTGAPPVETPSEDDARFRIVRSKGIGELLSMWRLDSTLPSELCNLLCLLLRVDTDDRLDIEQVWSHPWVQDTCPVEAQPFRFDRELDERFVGEEQTGSDAFASGLDREPTEPQEEVEAEGGSDGAAERRHKKRIKISVDHGCEVPSVALTGRVAGFFGGPVANQHREYCNHESSPQGSFRVHVPPETSPMVWPKVGVKAAARKLFQTANLSAQQQQHQETDRLCSCGGGSEDESLHAVPRDDEGNGRRRPRLDSSSSCSSTSSASSLQLIPKIESPDDSKDTTMGECATQEALVCRFCLRWVNANRCVYQVTLPTEVRPGSANEPRSKTRRVCNACFALISNTLTSATGDDLMRASEPSCRCTDTTHQTKQIT